MIEVVSTRPLKPQLQMVEGPPRLVIDLPDSILSTPRKRIPFRNQQIKHIRVNQNQTSPAVIRIVVDLSGPVRYTSDAVGNRLNIRIRADHIADVTPTAKPASVPAFTSGAQPVAVPYAEGTGGTLVEAGSRVASGASISAREETAVLRLTRGGEVRVCPGTTVSVTTSAAGQDLMLGMNTGAMETHYQLQESSDSVLTPDFRIVLPGPGEFDFAIRADAHGNTCVSSMPGSTASVVVAELLGNGTYEIKPDDQVLFRQGRLETVETPVAACGCPARQEPVLRASVDPSAVVPDEKAGTTLQLKNSSGHSNGQLQSTPDDPSGNADQGGPETEPLPKTKPGEMKVEVEAPLVFSGKARTKTRTSVPPAPLLEAASLPFSARPSDPLPPLVVLPPQPDPKPANKGFLRKIKGFLGAIFR